MSRPAITGIRQIEACRPAGCRPRSRAGSSAPGRPARSASISLACCAMPSIDSVPARLRRRRVIGDGEVAVAERPRRADHRLGRVAAVAPQRVRVQIALDVGDARPPAGTRRAPRARSRRGRAAAPAGSTADRARRRGPLRRRPAGHGRRRRRGRPASAAGRARGRARRAAPRARASRSSARSAAPSAGVGDGAQGDFLAVPDERDGVAAAPADVGGREAVRPGGHGGPRIAAGGEDQQIADGRLEAPQRTGRIQRQRRLGPAHRRRRADRPRPARGRGAAATGRSASRRGAPPRRPSAARARPPRDPRRRARRRPRRGRRDRCPARAMPATSRGSLRLGGRGRGGRAFAGDGGDVRRDRGIEGARGLVERRLQRLRIERRRVPGGGGEGGRGGRVAAQRGDAGEPAQGVGHVVGGGQSLPENQQGLLWLRPRSHARPRAGPWACVLLFVDAPARVDRTMAPDSVLAIRHAARRGRAAASGTRAAERASSSSTNPRRADRRTCRTGPAPPTASRWRRRCSPRRSRTRAPASGCRRSDRTAPRRRGPASRTGARTPRSGTRRSAYAHDYSWRIREPEGSSDASQPWRAAERAEQHCARLRGCARGP